MNRAVVLLAVAALWTPSAPAARSLPRSASMAVPLPANGAIFAVPATAVLAGSITLPPSDAPPGTIVRLSVSDTAPPDVPAALTAILAQRARHVDAWLRGSISNDVRFGVGTVAYRFDMPAVEWSSDEFYSASCDLSNCLRPYVSRPMFRDGAALEFSTAHVPVHFSFAARANREYLTAIFHAPPGRTDR